MDSGQPVERARQAAIPLEKTRRSLFGEILDWLLAPLLLLWPVSIAITFFVAKALANQPFDHALENRIMVLSQQILASDGKASLPLPAAAQAILRADDSDTIYYQIAHGNGHLLDGDATLPLPEPEEPIVFGRIALRDARYQGQELRIAWRYLHLQGTAPATTATTATHAAPYVLVQIGETLEKRNTLANEIIKGVILPQFFILPIALALVWFALSRGLSPLAQLQQKIRARQSGDLSPIDSRHVPEEISPLVDSLNDLLARQGQTITIQKRFIADAAHQMKTPLAGLRMQSELALRQTDPHEIARSLQQLATSTEAATRLVNQLLALARAEEQGARQSALETLDLSALMVAVVHDWIPVSFTQKIDLGLERPGQPVLIRGHALLLRELANNLIDNALRYTGANRSVTVRVRRSSQLAPDGVAGVAEAAESVMLEVEDAGPGIAPEEREKVFDRFYRILGSNVPGSGLGLAIVREIAQQHGARIEISSPDHAIEADRVGQIGKADPGAQPGCLIRVIFPALPAPDLPPESV